MSAENVMDKDSYSVRSYSVLADLTLSEKGT